jgi:hypothetical protein
LSNDAEESTTRKEDISDAADAEEDVGGGRPTRKRDEEADDTDDDGEYVAYDGEEKPWVDRGELNAAINARAVVTFIFHLATACDRP